MFIATHQGFGLGSGRGLRDDGNVREAGRAGAAGGTRLPLRGCAPGVILHIKQTLYARNHVSFKIMTLVVSKQVYKSNRTG